MTQIFLYTCLCLIYFSKQTNKSHTHVLILDMSQGLAAKAIYSHTRLTAGTYMFKWNAIQNAENIFSSRQQTAKGTSGSSPCVRTFISGTVWTFNYCNRLLYCPKIIINLFWLYITHDTYGRYHKLGYLMTIMCELLSLNC